MTRILLTPPQAEFLAAAEPFVGFVGGIGSGKSFVLCYDLFRRATSGGLYMMAAPTFPMLRDATLRSFFELAEALGEQVALNKSEMTARLPRSGAEVLFRSADEPNRMRGPNLSGVYLDEASVMHEDAYRISIGRLRRGGKFGYLRAGFTPMGRLHWTYDVFGKGRPDTNLVHARTLDNPFLDPKFETAVRQQYGDASRLAEQELGGEFIDWSGGVFEAPWFKKVHAGPGRAARVRYWDRGFTQDAGCPTAGVLIAKHPSGNGYRYCFEDVVRGKWSAHQRDATMRRTAEDDRRRYGPVTTVIEQEPAAGKESAQATASQLAGFHVVLDPVRDPKGERWLPLASQAEAGNVDVVEADWTRAFLDELAAVPGGRYKDQADAAAGAFSHVSGMSVGPPQIHLPNPGQGRNYTLPPDTFA